jgi:protein-disulfide isomerase
MGEFGANQALVRIHRSLSSDVSQRIREERKRTARERLREQRDQEMQLEKRKRALIAGGVVVVVLAVAAGVAVLAAGKKGGDVTPVTAPVGATGTDKLVISSGAGDPPSTLTVYEDFRCPACGAFEKTFRDVTHSLQNSGQVKVDYHLVTIIDGNLGGAGSLNAANAAACAQDQNKFRAYHDVLYANQPNESDDKFQSKAYLLQLAGKVPGLATTAFTTCVNNGTHDAWVKKSNAAFGSSGFNSTPTVLLNGRNIYTGTTPLTPAGLKQMVAQAAKGKKPVAATGAPAVASPGTGASAPVGSVSVSP